MSRREYLKKREDMMLDLRGRQLRDKEAILAGEKLSKKEEEALRTERELSAENVRLGSIGRVSAGHGDLRRGGDGLCGQRRPQRRDL